MAMAMSRVRASESRPGSLPKLVESPTGPATFLGRIMTPVFPRSAATAVTKSSALELGRSQEAGAGTRMDIIDMDGIQIIDDDDDYSGDENDSDDGMDSRTKAERAAEFQVAHNWLLKEETAIQAKKFDRTKRKLTIYLPDDDPLEGISNRLEEVQSMVKPKVELSDFLEELQPEQRDRILTITDMDHETVKNLRRRNWKKMDSLRHTFRMVLIMSLGANRSRRYFNPDDPEAGPAVMRKQRQLYRKGKYHMIKSSLSIELQEVMQTQPIYRTTEHVKRVTWLLKATKAFKHLFPTEMIEEVAKVVAYERYDDNRHLSYQGRPPERFYYVLAGRIHKLREYKLTSGCVNKPMGFMHKGSTSDPEEMENQWNRECHLVSKGPVEVLILSKDDFVRLQHTTQGPPIDFLYSIDLFKEFPCEMFMDNEDAIVYRYYGQNKIVAENVNRTPWLHVVKSGHVKVVRKQKVIDTRNDAKFLAKSTDELGCGRSFSHAKAMLGHLTSQRKMKNLTDISLPELMRRRSTTLIEEGMRGGRRGRKATLKLTTPIIREMPSREADESDARQDPKKGLSLPPIVVTESEPQHSVSGQSSRNTSKAGTPRQVKPEVSSAGAKQVDNNVQRNRDVPFQPHGTFLTREKTAAEIEALFKPKKAKKETPLRKTCVQLDLLKPGDVFGVKAVAELFRLKHQGAHELSRITGKDLGLETLDLPTIQKFEGPPLSLVSDGAEVIKISKRFFLQHAQNNTMLRVETMQRSYLTTDEAKDILYDKETWGQYKEALMKRLIESLPSMHDIIKKA